MKPAPFAYHRAHSVAEAVALLAGNAVRDALGLTAGRRPAAAGTGPVPYPVRANEERHRLTTEVRRYVSRTDLVAALVRELIITGRWTRGAAPPARPSPAFGVSQTPVREAMRRLDQKGCSSAIPIGVSRW